MNRRKIVEERLVDDHEHIQQRIGGAEDEDRPLLTDRTDPLPPRAATTTFSGEDGPMSTPAPSRMGPVLASVALGGALGALTRHGLDTLWPPAVSGVSWTILAINVTGGLFIGLLMEFLAHRLPRSHLVRPFWGTGFLGGYTTFSAYAMGVVTALERGAPQVALAYLALTLVGAFTSAWAASALVHRLLTHHEGRNR